MVRLLKEIQPDILHVRSRMPAWIIHLALKALDQQQRPAVVTSFHGMYPGNPYSAVMAKADYSIWEVQRGACSGHQSRCANSNTGAFFALTCASPGGQLSRFQIPLPCLAPLHRGNCR